MKRFAALVLIVSGALMAACGDTAPATTAAEPVVRDSAGITIVEHSERLAEGEPGMHLGDPLITIGMLDGPAGYTFSDIADIEWFGDGGVIVADGGTGTLRAFDATGSLLWMVGGHGGAPGEFFNLTSVHTWGDTVAAFDRTSQRIQRFDRDGAFASETVLSSESGPVREVLGRLEDGRWVGVVVGHMGNAGAFGLRTDVGQYHVFDSQGRQHSTFGPLPEIEMFVGHLQQESMRMVVPISRPLGRASARGVVGSHIVFGDASDPHLQYLDPEGALVRSVRYASRPERVTDSDWASFREYWVERASAQSFLPEEAFRRFFDEVPRPDHHPAHGRLITGTDGTMWLMVRILPDESRLWAVLDSSGTRIGSVALPSGIGIRAVSRDRLWAVVRDGYGVEYARLYPLHQRTAQ